MTESVRDRLLALVRQYPGLHQRELARQLGTSLALVQYHAKALLEEGLIVREEEGGTVRLYVPGSQVDRNLTATLRDRRRLSIVLPLLEHGEMRHGDLVEVTGMGKSTLSFHLRHLQKDGVVEKTEEGGFRLCQPETVRETLASMPPTPDIMDRFADIWGDLYG